MFEDLGFETLTAPQVAVFFALGLGVAFGFLAERTKFCFRRAIVGEDRKQAAGIWMMALAVALLGTQAAVGYDLISFDEHRLLTSDLPLAGLLLGGVLFGAGMVLTRGCASRLTVLSATGNLRAALVLLIFAVIAHATLKGVLAPVRVAVTGWTVDLGALASLGSLPGGALFWSALISALLIALALRSGNHVLPLFGAALIGALVPLGWVGTGFVLYDDFDPIALQSLSFTQPWADSLFWAIASSSIPAGFGVGLVGGVLLGSFVSALLARHLHWQSFSSPRETGRYVSGGALMGVGGVLAGGCTIGAGLAGIPMLSTAALLALAAMGLGAYATNLLLRGQGSATLVAAE
jgi:uncharacterized membrane protein YedE/YeeE